MTNSIRTTLIFLLAAIGSARADVEGVIRGTAIDTEGTVMKGATIFAFPLSNNPQLRAVPGVETDENGTFVIDHLPYGQYQIETMKEEDGYPRTYVPIYKQDKSLTVTLGENVPVAYVTVPMGPRCAIITGVLKDQSTGEPVLRAQVRLWRMSDPGNVSVIGVRPSFRVLVPPGVDVGFEVISDDHESWRLSKTPLHLESGSVHDILEVRLSRKAK